MAATKMLMDAGPLIGFLNCKDQHHGWAVESWSALTEPLWTCEAVLSEVIFNLQSEGMSLDSIFHFVESGIIQLDFSVNENRADIFNLLRKYADQPMSLADACLVRMAELNDNCQIFTTDKDFFVYRRKGRHVIPLLAPFDS
jgi:predicted nucleic acid-binding protein